jgi:hypothetical protein
LLAFKNQSGSFTPLFFPVPVVDTVDNSELTC